MKAERKNEQLINIHLSFVFLQENGRSVPDVTASPGRAPPGPIPVNQMHHQTIAIANQQNRQTMKEPVLQGDFRKVSGISSEIFRQIEAVENDHDPNTAAALEVRSLYWLSNELKLVWKYFEKICVKKYIFIDFHKKY